MRPQERPASLTSSASLSAVSGACGGGFRTIEQPLASAGASLWHTRLSGKLNGAIAITGPARHPRVSTREARRGFVEIERHDLAAHARGLFPTELERADRALHLGSRDCDRFARLTRDELGE